MFPAVADEGVPVSVLQGSGPGVCLKLNSCTFNRLLIFVVEICSKVADYVPTDNKYDKQKVTRCAQYAMFDPVTLLTNVRVPPKAQREERRSIAKLWDLCLHFVKVC